MTTDKNVAKREWGLTTRIVWLDLNKTEGRGNIGNIGQGQRSDNNEGR